MVSITNRAPTSRRHSNTGGAGVVVGPRNTRPTLHGQPHTRRSPQPSHTAGRSSAHSPARTRSEAHTRRSPQPSHTAGRGYAERFRVTTNRRRIWVTAPQATTPTRRCLPHVRSLSFYPLTAPQCGDCSAARASPCWLVPRQLLSPPLTPCVRRQTPQRWQSHRTGASLDATRRG